MQEIMEKLEKLIVDIVNIEGVLGLPQKKQKVIELEDEMNSDSFWDDQVKAGQVAKKMSNIKEEVELFENLQKETSDLLFLSSEAKDLADEEFTKDIENRFIELERTFKQVEMETLFHETYDDNDCLVAVHAGTGGTDAQDWTEMLERMFLRFAEKKGFKVSILDRQVGEEAGIKKVIFEVKGPHAYGFFKSESGVHRLVRISPFDAEKMRHTSFALTEVEPLFEELEEIELKDDEIEIDTFKSGGHGGQSVNTTDSAVRVKHVPTGIVVSCQNERSQLQNKQTAFKILKSKLKKYQEAEHEEERKKIRGEYSEGTWGNQIRSYVLHPYKMVKDHRTNYETQEVNKVLDGELFKFIESFLKKEASKNNS
jgi:peptide chain release factor 2